MVTEITGVGVGHSVVGQLGESASQRVVEPARPEAANASIGAVAGESHSSFTQVAGLYAKLRVHQDAINKSASAIREVGVTIEKAGQLLSKMEEELGAIVKMYPPYPIDNPERVSFLNSFGGLRKQTEALTFPPPEALDTLGGLFSRQDGANSKDAGKTEQRSTVSLIQEPMLGIPALDALAAGDAEIGKVFDQVKSMRSAIEVLKSGMWNDVISFVKQSDSTEAQGNAADVRKQLSSIGNLGIGINAGHLDQVAKS
jgi:hypothetical protein